MQLSAYLALEDESLQLGTRNPMKSTNHGQAAAHPPGIADILQLLRSAVETSIGQLSLAQPSSQAVSIDQVKPVGDGQSSDAGEDLPRMGFGPRNGPKTTIEIGAALDMLDRAVDVDQIHQAHQREGIERAIQETGILLAPLVT
jgi:hypothetical protein